MDIKASVTSHCLDASILYFLLGLGCKLSSQMIPPKSHVQLNINLAILLGSWTALKGTVISANTITSNYRMSMAKSCWPMCQIFYPGMYRSVVLLSGNLDKDCQYTLFPTDFRLYVQTCLKSFVSGLSFPNTFF